MKRILVTGATGFIGNYVIGHLLSEGHHVIASSAHEDRARSATWFDRVTYIPFDLAGFDTTLDYYAFFGRPDTMIHLAWEGLPNYKSAFHMEINYPGHAAFLKNLLSHGLGDLIVTGTCFEYGFQEGCLSEDLPSMPANPYATAKDSLRRFLEGLQGRFPFVFRWVRLFYMYGKGQNANSLLSQLDKALENRNPVFNMSGGEQVRDFLPVEKMSEYLVRIAIQKEVTGIINCCSGHPVTVKDLVLNYLEKKNAKISLNLGYYPYPDYEPMRFWGNDAKLKTILKNE